VTLHTSSGPAPTPVQPDPNTLVAVPNVVNLPFGQAQQQLQQAGFQVNAYFQQLKANNCLVAAQTPVGQAQMAKGSVVAIAVDGQQDQCH
jgi:beta-lactam-binding protein with PASTA domain